MKFLIIRFSSIGDIVLTTPVIRCLHQQVQGAEIHFLTKKAYVQVLQGNPYLHRIHALEEDLADMLKILKGEQFDAVIDLHHNLRSLRVKRALENRAFSFRKLNMEKWLLTNLKIDRMPDLHIVDRYLETLKEFGVKNDREGLDYFIPEITEHATDVLPANFRSGYLCMVAGAAHATKRIPVQKMREICEAVKLPVVLLGGKEEREAAQEVAAVHPEKIFNACGVMSLHQSAVLIRESRHVISSDTGLMHIAAALKKPVTVLWGNTVPQFGMYPYYGKYSIHFSNLEVGGLSCRPCSKIGYGHCPKKHFKCMLEQSVDAVVQSISQSS